MFLSFGNVNPLIRLDALYEHILSEDEILPQVIGRDGAVGEENRFFRAGFLAESAEDAAQHVDLVHGGVLFLAVEGFLAFFALGSRHGDRFGRAGNSAQAAGGAVFTPLCIAFQHVHAPIDGREVPLHFRVAYGGFFGKKMAHRGGKPFQDGSGKDLPSDIVRIEANFGEGSSAGQIDKLSEDELDKVGELLKAKARERNAERALSTVEANRKKKLEGQRAHELAKADPKTKASPQELEAQSKQIADDLSTLDRSLKTRREAFRQSQIDSAEAAAGVELGNLLRTDKRDAMSVYGRFDSAGGASAASSPSANLTAGKIFSTGVASQNLTEAARLQAATGGLAACLDSLTSLLRALPDDERKAALEKFSGACAVRSGTAK